MWVYRISSRQYARDFSGAGAGLYGGRWNPVGVRLLYTAGTISLACLEYLAHNFHVLASQQICLAKIRIKEPVSIETVSLRDLPPGWSDKSVILPSTQAMGAGFVKRSQAYLLQVPSVIVPDEYNFLLNPLHPHHAHTEIEELSDPFVLDNRLFGKS